MTTNSEIKALLIDALHSSNLSDSKKKKWEIGFLQTSDKELRDVLIGIIRNDIEVAAKLEDNLLKISASLAFKH